MGGCDPCHPSSHTVAHTPPEKPCSMPPLLLIFLCGLLLNHVAGRGHESVGGRVALASDHSTASGVVRRVASASDHITASSVRRDCELNS